jgi:hypothetical protein
MRKRSERAEESARDIGRDTIDPACREGIPSNRAGDSLRLVSGRKRWRPLERAYHTHGMKGAKLWEKRVLVQFDCGSAPYWKVDMRRTMFRNGKINRFVGLNRSSCVRGCLCVVGLERASLDLCSGRRGSSGETAGGRAQSHASAT